MAADLTIRATEMLHCCLTALERRYLPTEPAVKMTKKATISAKIIAIMPCTVLLMYTGFTTS